MSCKVCKRGIGFGDRVTFPWVICTVCKHIEMPYPVEATYTNIAIDENCIYHVFVADEILVCGSCGHTDNKCFYPCGGTGLVEEEHATAEEMA